MDVAVFSTRPYDVEFLEAANARHGHRLVWLEPRLVPETLRLAEGFPAVSIFVHDQATGDVLRCMAAIGVRLLALRSAGFNNVDLAAAAETGIRVVRVPAYSPHAVAEHTVALMLALDRKVHRAWARVRDGNFSLVGLLGFTLHGKTVGVVGTGAIGAVVCRILRGFGAEVLAADPYPRAELQALGVRYVELDALWAASDVVTLHCPLTPESRHLVGREALARMRDGVMIVNTSRGELLDTDAVIESLKSGRVGFLGLDVYEEEERLFFRDLSLAHIPDDRFARLLTFPNVLVTGHQGFFTREALSEIAATTLESISDFAAGRPLRNEVGLPGG